MKVKAEAFINSKRSINFDKILITGSDEAFVSYVKNHIIQDFKNRNYFIDFTNNYTTNSMGGLFSENKTLFVLSDFPTDMENDKTKMHGQCILVALLNGKKTNAIKDETIIAETLPTARSFPLSIAPLSGINRPTRQTKVTKTAI